MIVHRSIFVSALKNPSFVYSFAFTTSRYDFSVKTEKIQGLCEELSQENKKQPTRKLLDIRTIVAALKIPGWREPESSSYDNKRCLAVKYYQIDATLHTSLQQRRKWLWRWWWWWTQTSPVSVLNTCIKLCMSDGAGLKSWASMQRLTDICL